MLEKHTYCVKCQAGKTVIGQSPFVMKNGSVALKGRCPSCDTTAYKIVSKDALNKAEPAPSAKKLDRHLVIALGMFGFGLAAGAIIAMFL